MTVTCSVASFLVLPHQHMHTHTPSHTLSTHTCTHTPSTTPSMHTHMYTQHNTHTPSHTHTHAHVHPPPHLPCTHTCTHTDSVDEDKMLAEGISRFCEDANLDPTSLTVLILAWKFKAATQCEFTRKEFVDGMADIGWVFIAASYLTCRVLARNLLP